MQEYKYEIIAEPLGLIIIDPSSLSESQKRALIEATLDFKKGINFWHAQEQDKSKETLEYPAMIDRNKRLSDALQEHGNCHTDGNGDVYLYFTQCFKFTTNGILTIEPYKYLPDYVKAGMLKAGVKFYPRSNG